MLRFLVGATVALTIALAIPVGAGQTVPAASVATTSYNDFMRLDAKQRQDRFGQLAPESKAMLVRTHAEQWLAKNRSRLDGSQIAVFQEAIAFITPGIYSKPLDPTLLKKEEEVKTYFRCRVDPTDVSAAFDVLGKFTSPDASARWNYLSRAKCWIGWFAESVIEYLPTVPKPTR